MTRGVSVVGRAAGRTGRWGIAAWVALCVLLVATSCAVVPRLGPTPKIVEANTTCPIGSVRSCALPYPSDEFTVADPNTATGRRVQLPDDLLPAPVLDRLGPGAGPDDVFAGADGFAALSPVIFELDRPVAPSSLPRDGGDVLAVFDLHSGERIPIRAEVPADAARLGGPDTIVMAWPTVRWEPGRTYVARLTDGLRSHDGGRPGRAPGLQSASLDAADPDHADGLRAALAAIEGDRWSQVINATRFSIRSEQNATAELDAMAAVVRSSEHRVRRVSIAPPFLIGDVAAGIVTGEVEISDFRDADGVARVSNGARSEWVRFLMVLPAKPAGPDGAPVVIYGHGLTVAKETMLGIAAANAALGLATIGIDVPNHGDRQAGQGGYLLDLTTPRKFGRLASMLLQGVVDNLSLLMAVQSHFAQMEFTAPALLTRPSFQVPRLDTSRILYQGTSMGGVLGAAFVALAPELDGAFLQVAGTGIADTILHSLLWPLFMGIVPDNATTGDAYALMGAATMLLDPADSVNVVGRIKANGTPVFLAYGVGDGIVPNYISDRLITLADLPVIGRQLTSVSTPHTVIGGDGVPADGRGAVHLWPFGPSELQSFTGHLAFLENRSDSLLREWVQGRLEATGVPTG